MSLEDIAKANADQTRLDRMKRVTKPKQAKAIQNATYLGKAEDGTDIVQVDGQIGATSGHRLISNKSMAIGDRVQLRPSFNGLQRVDAKNQSIPQKEVEKDVLDQRYPVKILYLDQVTNSFYIGGDRAKLKFIYQHEYTKTRGGHTYYLSYNDFNSRLDNIGITKADWIFTAIGHYQRSTPPTEQNPYGGIEEFDCIQVVSPLYTSTEYVSARNPFGGKEYLTAITTRSDVRVYPKGLGAVHQGGVSFNAVGSGNVEAYMENPARASAPYPEWVKENDGYTTDAKAGGNIYWQSFIPREVRHDYSAGTFESIKAGILARTYPSEFTLTETNVTYPYLKTLVNAENFRDLSTYSYHSKVMYGSVQRYTRTDLDEIVYSPALNIPSRMRFFHCYLYFGSKTIESSLSVPILTGDTNIEQSLSQSFALMSPNSVFAESYLIPYGRQTTSEQGHDAGDGNLVTTSEGYYIKYPDGQWTEFWKGRLVVSTYRSSVTFNRHRGEYKDSYYICLNNGSTMATQKSRYIFTPFTSSFQTRISYPAEVPLSTITNNQWQIDRNDSITLVDADGVEHLVPNTDPNNTYRSGANKVLFNRWVSLINPDFSYEYQQVRWVENRLLVSGTLYVEIRDFWGNDNWYNYGFEYPFQVYKNELIGYSTGYVALDDLIVSSSSDFDDTAKFLAYKDWRIAFAKKNKIKYTVSGNDVIYSGARVIPVSVYEYDENYVLARVDTDVEVEPIFPLPKGLNYRTIAESYFTK